MSAINSRTLAGWLIFSVCLGLLSFHLGYPDQASFDEFHYVPASKYFLGTVEVRNLEHPPLGKMLIATGIKLFGDTPTGWRSMPVFFGALSMLGIFLWILLIFGSLSWAYLGAGLTFFNQVFYVQSRIAMLDIFMFSFLIWALYFLHLAIRKTNFRFLFLSSAFWGCAIATKWTAAIIWLMCFIVLAIYFFISKRHSPFFKKYSPYLLIGTITFVPAFTYFLSFMPYFLKGDLYAKNFFSQQWNMYLLQQNVSEQTHGYSSHWLSWPLMIRPIWYHFKQAGENFRGVDMIGNPLIMWAGLIAMIYCAYDAIRNRNKRAQLIVALYSIFYFCWALIPRKLTFYYYYFPPATFLSFALVHVFDRFRWLKARWVFLGLSGLMFWYFLPILAAIEVPLKILPAWMWFRRWL